MEENWPSENQPGTTSGSGTDPAQVGIGPFHAQVWSKIGSVDAWGLPELTAYKTTASGGMPAIAITDGDNWAVFTAPSFSRITTAWNAFKSTYNYTEITGKLPKF
tara:strand:- start:1164 stop:1478 length:315 start_codon:yes stop_codon:yes gene_type:complete